MPSYLLDLEGENNTSSSSLAAAFLNFLCAAELFCLCDYLSLSLPALSEPSVFTSTKVVPDDSF